MQKVNYFYIDESGHVNNNSNVFVHGCIKTDTPILMEDALIVLRDELLEMAYFEEFVDKINKQGFHAVDNHPDIRARFYSILPFLNYRAYFIVVDKNSEYFKDLKKTKEDHELFELFLTKLLRDRLKKNKLDKNIFVFEEIKIEKRSLKEILDCIFSKLSQEYTCSYSIESKKMINLGTVDYLNYILYSILEDISKVNLRMEQNFNLVKHKIGVINILHKNVYLSRKKDVDHQIEVKNLKKQYSG